MRVACVHLPHFAVELERQRLTSPSRLIIIGEQAVYDCSREASKVGVRPGMRVSEALGICGKALTLPTDLPYYERRFNDVLDLLEGSSPVEPATLGTAYLLLDGLSDQPTVITENIRSTLHSTFGLTSCIAIAPNKFLSYVATQLTEPDELRVIGGPGARDPGATADYIPS